MERLLNIEIQKFEETGNLIYIYKGKWDKACFAQDATVSDSKDLAKRTISDKKIELMKLL